MEQKHRRRRVTKVGRTSGAGADASREEMVRRARELARIADRIIGQSQSRDSEQYLRENRQRGAQ